MDPSELPPESNARIAIEHTTVVMTPSVYIQWLHDRLATRGVRFVRAAVTSIAEVEAGNYGTKPDVIVNATGVGAKSLGGVMDTDVEPIRYDRSCFRSAAIYG
jgi:D-amino-acid oxidase